MVSTRFDQTIPFPRSSIFEWHARMGAARRLTPPFLADVVKEPEGGLTDRGRITYRIRRLPAPANRWVTETSEIEPGSGYLERLARGSVPRWQHRRHFDDLGATTRMRDEVEFWLPRRFPRFTYSAFTDLMAEMVTFQHSQILGDLEFGAAHPGPPRRIAVSGSHGTVGTQLTALLRTLGHTVVPIVRATSPQQGAIALDPAGGWVDTPALAGTDVVIHLAGESIFGRFSEAKKRRILESRVRSTTALAAAVARTPGVRALICASAIGYYGADPGHEVAEDASPGDDFLARVCVEWERSADAAREAGIRVVHVRSGIVMTSAAGALAAQLPLFRAGVGGPLAGGDAWLSWVSLDDIAGIYAHAALDERVEGGVNGVAPRPVTSGEFAQQLGRVLSRPAAIPVPGVGPSAILGVEGANLLAFASQRVSAQKIASTGYEFRHPTLTGALRHTLGATT